MGKKIHLKKFREFNVKELNELSENFSLLHQFSEIIDKFDEKRDLEYFSNFYNEISPIVEIIVIYIVNNKLAGINKTVDEYIFCSQKIVDHLKVLHSRYELMCKHSMNGKHSDWYFHSKKESGDILNDIGLTIKGMLTLKEQHLSY